MNENNSKIKKVDLLIKNENMKNLVLTYGQYGNLWIFYFLLIVGNMVFG